MSVTPVVFWAVRAVIALMAYTPWAVIVLISAWMPAPPLESEPAIVNAVFIFVLLLHALILYSDKRWCPRFAAGLIDKSKPRLVIFCQLTIVFWPVHLDGLRLVLCQAGQKCH